jgi:nicotinamide phosphoribosyltransferase
MENLILLTDSYKITHHLQYPPNTTKIYSYFESRGSSNPTWNSVLFFGLQYIVKKYFIHPITINMIDEAEKILTAHFHQKVFNRAGWEYIVKHHQGRLPVSIKAVPEGTVVKGLKNVLFTVVNTDPECFWLVNYLETLLVQVWYPCTVATQSMEMKKVLRNYLKLTGTKSKEIEKVLEFQLHDFGFRGTSSVETSGIGAAAHLVSFKGTDTLTGLIVAKEYYGCADVAGFSIPASEHSTMTTWGEAGEIEACKNMVEKFGKNGGYFACVSDSYDVFRVCGDYWGNQLKSLIVESVGGSQGRLVVRPDSGDPARTIIRILRILGGEENSNNGYKKFITKTETGHKLLPPFLRVIQGDGIEWSTLEDILKKVTDAGWAAENLVFGSGGGLLQKLNRDTLKFAMKCSFATVNGEDREVCKNPTTDPGKQSKKGRLSLVRSNEGQFISVPEDHSSDCLVEVFRDGKLLVDWDFETIRRRTSEFI